MKASDLFVDVLEAEGVRWVFGVPGEENGDVMLSLADSAIDFVACRHEQAAAFMAYVVGRLTGEPGVALSTLGPGATNLLTGIACADMDHVPVVAITGQGATTRLHQPSHQAMDAVRVFREVTKRTQTAWSPATVVEVTREAFRVARAERPGAAHVELPEDVAASDVDDREVPPTPRVRRAVADQAAIDAALEALAAAERPLVLAGHGCVRMGAHAELTRFAERTGIHVATTFQAKGAISDRDERSLFAAGLGFRDHVVDVIEEADLVLAVGYDMVEWGPSNLAVGREKRFVHVHLEPAPVDAAYRPAVEVHGDVADALRRLADGATDAHRPDPSWSTPADVRQRLADELLDPPADDAFPVKPQRVIADVRAELGDDDVLVCDVGAHKMWVARNYPTYAPNTCLVSNGFASMGLALPGAAAAKLVHPDRRVVGLSGDGGFLMNVHALGTAFQHGIPSVHVVLDDGGYGLIAWKQERELGDTSGTDLRHHDLAAVARGFGAHAVRLEAADELRPALRDAFVRTDVPTVIVVPVDADENLRLSRRLDQ